MFFVNVSLLLAGKGEILILGIYEQNVFEEIIRYLFVKFPVFSEEISVVL